MGDSLTTSDKKLTNEFFDEVGAAVDKTYQFNDAVLAFQRVAPTGVLLGLFNFTEQWQHLPEGWVRALGVTRMWDALSEAEVQPHGGQVVLPPYARVWLL